MLTGKYSAVKGFALLFAIVLALLDIVFTSINSPIVKWVNCAIVVGIIVATVIYYWKKWDKKE